MQIGKLQAMSDSIFLVAHRRFLFSVFVIYIACAWLFRSVLLMHCSLGVLCIEVDLKNLCQITFCAANTQRIDTSQRYVPLLDLISCLCVYLGWVMIWIYVMVLWNKVASQRIGSLVWYCHFTKWMVIQWSVDLIEELNCWNMLQKWWKGFSNTEFGSRLISIIWSLDLLKVKEPLTPFLL